MDGTEGRGKWRKAKRWGRMERGEKGYKRKVGKREERNGRK